MEREVEVLVPWISRHHLVAIRMQVLTNGCFGFFAYCVVGLLIGRPET